MAAKLKEAKELTTTDEAALQHVVEDMDTGFEDVTAADLVISRIVILQGLSPQVSTQSSEYIEGAKVGDIFDTGLKAIVTAPFDFLPIVFKKTWLQWEPRERKQRGFPIVHDSPRILDETQRNERGQNVLANGDYIQETSNLFGILVANRHKCVIPFTSTQLRKVKDFLTQATQDLSDGEPRLWSRICSLSTVPESNKKGNWMGWRIRRTDLFKEHPDFDVLEKERVKFRESVRSGAVKVDQASDAEEAFTGQTIEDDKDPF